MGEPSVTQESNNQQILLRLPRAVFDALLKHSAQETLLRNERVTIQTVVREAVSEYLEGRERCDTSRK